jgi:hypothetical protein
VRTQWHGKHKLDQGHRAGKLLGMTVARAAKLAALGLGFIEAAHNPGCHIRERRHIITTRTRGAPSA